MKLSTDLSTSKRIPQMCAHCGKSFVYHRKKKYCSDSCGYHARNPGRLPRNQYIKSIRADRAATCEGCGQAYIKDRVAQRYCSKGCGATRNEYQKSRQVDKTAPKCKVSFNQCAVCNRWFSSKTPIAKYCSAYCSSKYHLESTYKQDATTHCKGCGILFSRIYGHRRAYCCSEKCSSELKERTKRIARSRRRAREKQGYTERIDPIEIFERDQWVCQLCGIKTPQKLRGTYGDTAPELDHIIPISKGGPHIKTNVQCSCRKCNSDKGDKERGQLLLLG